MTDPSELKNAAAQHSTSLREIINALIVRRSAGETVTDESVIQRYPELMPELADELQNLRIVEAAEVYAQSPPEGLRIRCPHCHNPVELVDDASLSEIICPSCRSGFSLTNDTDRTFQASQQELVNHFQLLDRVGVGAFGSVWSARDTQLDRIVALKIPRKGQLSPDEAEQFIREARAAAQLKHPNIVSVLEVGRYKDRIYIACDFVQGLDLADWLTDQQATPGEAAELCATLADALQHAHQQGVIHRDIKPSNVMLDAAGEPHLMDFGLAKRDAGEITMTIDGKLLGTPAYMSPEQARGAAHDADARSDVYSLGVILFELLTGERPFRGSTRMLLHQVLVEDAPSPRSLNQGVPRDLATICLKCLEKDPARRYQTAGELRDDLKRFLSGEPVQARPITRAGRAWRWCKRKPVVAGLAAGLSAAVLVGLVGVTSQWIRAEHNAADAESEAARNRRLLYSSDMNLALQAWEFANVGRVLELLNRHRPESDKEDLRCFEWYHLWQLCQRSLATPTLEHGAGVWRIAFSPDGRTVASGGWDGSVKLWDVSRRELKATLTGHGDRVWMVAYSPDGKTLASGDGRGAIKLWNVKTAKVLATFDGHTDAVNSLAFSPDGETLASASDDHSIKLWHLDGTTQHMTLAGHSDKVTSVKFFRDGKSLASGSHDHTLKLWNVSTGTVEATLKGHASAVRCLAFSPNDNILASGDESGDVKLWKVAMRHELTSFQVSSRAVLSVAFSKDGQALATGGQNNTVTFWDAKTNALVDTLKGHSSEVFSVAFSPTENLLASSSASGAIKLWDITPPTRDKITGHAKGVACVVFSPDSRTLTSASHDGTVKLWDHVSGALLGTYEGHSNAVNGVAFSHDGKKLVSCGEDMTIRVWDVASETALVVLQDAATNRPTKISPVMKPGISSVALSADGKTVVSSSTDGTLKVWDLASGKVIDALVGHTAWVPSLALDASQERLASGSWDGTVRLWDMTTGEEERVLTNVGEVLSVAFSPDGKRLAAGTEQRLVHVWNLEAGERYRFAEHTGGVFSVAFSPDGTSLATGSWDGTVILRDGKTGELRISLKSLASVYCVAFSADGQTLAAGDQAGNIHLWRASTE